MGAGRLLHCFTALPLLHLNRQREVPIATSSAEVQGSEPPATTGGSYCCASGVGRGLVADHERVTCSVSDWLRLQLALADP